MAVERLLVDDTTRTRTDVADLARQLWAIDCMTCGRSLGSEPPALVVHDMVAFGAAGLHHPDCRTPQWEGQGMLQMSGNAFLSYITNAFLLPMTRDEGATHALVPFILINPSLEQVMLKPDGDRESWRVSSMDTFGQMGLVPMGPQLSMDPLDGAQARLRGDELTLALDVPAAGGPWTTTVNTRFITAARETDAVMMGLTTALNPVEVEQPSQLAAAMEAGEVALGMAALQR